MHHKILVELDALLDTRWGVMSKLNTEAGKALVVPEYYSRASDNFEQFQSLVSHATFKEAYAKRDKTALIGSVLTTMNFVLGRLIASLESEKVDNSDRIESVTIIINTYPYLLSENEQQAVKLAVGARCGTFSKIEIDYIPLNEISIPFINVNKYTYLIIYNFIEWATLNLGESLFNSTEDIPHVKVIIPAMFDPDQPIPTEKDLVDHEGNAANPFLVMPMFYASIICLQPHPVEFFSPVNPDHI